MGTPRFRKAPAINEERTSQVFARSRAYMRRQGSAGAWAGCAVKTAPVADAPALGWIA